MKKSDVFKLIAGIGVSFFPGGDRVAAGIQALKNRNDDPTDDVDEVADAVTEIVMGVILSAEGLSGADLVNDPVLAQLAANIKGDIRLAQQLLIARKR
ncbi:MAG: hypothetical protein ABMA15_15535 [Vicinamibacterales bacterium]